jgi:hypothetical protein
MYSSSHGGFRQVALVGLEVGHLAQRAGGRIGLADPGQFLLERHAFFEQGELDLVVVVAGGKATECEHGGCLRKMERNAARYRRHGLAG